MTTSHDFSFGKLSINIPPKQISYKSLETPPLKSLKPSNLHCIFNKISDITNHQQINDAMLEVKTVKERSKLLELILRRKSELEDLNQFMRFHNIGHLLQKIKGKIMTRLAIIRERKKSDPKIHLTKRLSVFSPSMSPRSPLLKRTSIPSECFQIQEIQSPQLENIMKNPKAMDMVVNIYKAMQIKRKSENLDEKKMERKGAVLKIFDSMNYKKEYEQYQMFIKKHVDVKTRQEIFNKIRIEHLKKMEKVKKAEKYKSAQNQLEEDLCSFFIKDHRNDEMKDKMEEFFETGIRNKEIKKVEENAKGRLLKILKCANPGEKQKIDLNRAKKIQNLSLPMMKNFGLNKSLSSKKNLQNSTLLTNYMKKKGLNEIGLIKEKDNNLINKFTEQDSLGSAYEFKLEGLYGETTQLNNKIKGILNFKEQRNLKNYKIELMKAENEIYKTVKNKLYEKNFLQDEIY